MTAKVNRKLQNRNWFSLANQLFHIRHNLCRLQHRLNACADLTSAGLTPAITTEKIREDLKGLNAAVQRLERALPYKTEVF